MRSRLSTDWWLRHRRGWRRWRWTSPTPGSRTIRRIVGREPPGAARPAEFVADELGLALRATTCEMQRLLARTRRLRSGLPTVYAAALAGRLDADRVSRIDRAARLVTEEHTLTVLDEQVVPVAVTKTGLQLTAWLNRFLAEHEPRAFRERNARMTARPLSRRSAGGQPRLSGLADRQEQPVGGDHEGQPGEADQPAEHHVGQPVMAQKHPAEADRDRPEARPGRSSPPCQPATPADGGRDTVTARDDRAVQRMATGKRRSWARTAERRRPAGAGPGPPTPCRPA